MSQPTSGAGMDWSGIISGAIEGAGSGMKSTAEHASSKKEALEAKRRTLANLFQNAMKRNRTMFRQGQEYGDEMNDYQSQALQQVARGFVDALHGSTGRI